MGAKTVRNSKQQPAGTPRRVNARKIRQAEARATRDARRRAEQPVAGSRRAERAEVWAAVAERREAARTAAREERRARFDRTPPCAGPASQLSHKKHLILLSCLPRGLFACLYS